MEETVKTNLLEKSAIKINNSIAENMSSVDEATSIYIERLCSQHKSIKRNLMALYFFTFIGSYAIIAGDSVGLAIINPLEVPIIKNIPVEIFAAFVAVIYAACCKNFSSATLLVATISATLEHKGVKLWQHYIAQHDASLLWTALKEIESDRTPLKWAKNSMMIVPLSIQMIHGFIVVGSCTMVFMSALDTDNMILQAAGMISFVISTVSFLSLSIAIHCKD